MAKKVVEAGETGEIGKAGEVDKVVETGKAVETVETGKVDKVVETEAVEEIVDKDAFTELEKSAEFGKKSEKALLIAKSYGVSKVWCTADGIFWATTEEKKIRLPKNRGGIEEYSFPAEG